MEIDFRTFTDGCSINRIPGIPDEEVHESDVIFQVDGYSRSSSNQLLIRRYRFMMSTTDFRAIYSMIFVKCPSILELDDYIRSVISEAHSTHDSILIHGKRSRHRSLTRNVDIHLRNATKKTIVARYSSIDCNLLVLTYCAQTESFRLAPCPLLLRPGARLVVVPLELLSLHPPLHWRASQLLRDAFQRRGLYPSRISISSGLVDDALLVRILHNRLFPFHKGLQRPPSTSALPPHLPGMPELR